jgi:demethylmenaquinone methyltransferase/2-methoxy-6-polyprenyl-1,4-benzoquinol methylase
MPDKNPSEISGFYDGIFYCYDAANAFLTLGLDGRWRRAAARLALASRPERVLDVCCGTGSLSLELHRLSGGRAAVTGLDFNEAMLSRARAKNSAITFIRGDADALPFPDAAFDALTASFAARNLNDGGKGLLKYFREFHRVLKPGGSFVNIETSQPDSRFIRSLFHAYVRSMTAMVRLPAPEHKAAYGFLAGTIAAFYTPEELSKMILAAGFSKVEARPLMFGAVAIHSAVK